MTVEEQLKSMQEKLRETISMRNYIEDKFQVFAWEASVGKSKYTTEFIAEQINLSMLEKDVKPIKYLVVKKFAAEVVEMEEQLNKLLWGRSIGLAVGLTTENYGELISIPNLLNHAYVLIITHSRYIELCKKPLEQPFGQRDVLIIDEKIQFPNYTFSKSKYDHFRKELPYSLQGEFDEWNAELLIRLEKLDEHGKNQIRVFSVEKNLSQLNSFFEKLKPYNLSDEMEEFLNQLEHFYNREIIYNNSSLFVMDKRYKMRMLKNNIILDASAVLEPIYQADKFVIVEDTKVIDYKKSNVFYEFRNSSITNWTKDKKLLSRIEAYIPFMLKRKSLIISHKEQSKAIQKMLLSKQEEGLTVHIPKSEENLLEECNVALNWFGNIVGQNQYSDFDTCFLVGTFNLPYPIYLLQYAFYNEIESFKGLNIQVKEGRFENTLLESIRVGSIAAEFYQAAKRVQRNMSPKAVMVIFNHDEHVADLLHTQFSDINFYFVEKKEVSNPEKVTQGSKLKEWLLNKEKGNYRKAQIKKELQLNSNNFSRLISSPEIKELIQVGKIKVTRHAISIEA